MKKIILTSIFLFTTYIFSQNKNTLFNCEEIKKGIIDSTLYETLSNGKLISRIDLHKNKIYIIKTDKSNFYYVSHYIKKKIKKSIKQNNCLGIKIENVPNLKKANIKIIRD